MRILNKRDLWAAYEVVAVSTFHNHIITIWAVGNQLAIMMFALSHGHGITICNFPCWFLISNVTGEAGRRFQVVPTDFLPAYSHAKPTFPCSVAPAYGAHLWILHSWLHSVVSVYRTHLPNCSSHPLACLLGTFTSTHVAVMWGPCLTTCGVIKLQWQPSLWGLPSLSKVIVKFNVMWLYRLAAGIPFTIAIIIQELIVIW